MYHYMNQYYYDSTPIVGVVTFSRFPKFIVFPLTRRPFWNMSLPSPRMTKRFLQTNFDLDTCYSGYWNHSAEAWRKGGVTLPCKDLKSHHPFVDRIELPTGEVEEVLKVGDVVVNRVKLEEETIGAQATFCTAAGVNSPWGPVLV